VGWPSETTSTAWYRSRGGRSLPPRPAAVCCNCAGTRCRHVSTARLSAQSFALPRPSVHPTAISWPLRRLYRPPGSFGSNAKEKALEIKHTKSESVFQWPKQRQRHSLLFPPFPMRARANKAIFLQQLASETVLCAISRRTQHSTT
jgi:hypothetical protein